MKEIIHVENLYKEYVTYSRGGTFADAVKSLFHREKVLVKAVNGISFSIGEGEIVGLLGKNGAGKSTTIKMLTGVLTPSSGVIDVIGYSPARQRAKYVGKIGAVFGQKSQLIWDIPPIDSFAMNKAIYGIEDNRYDTALRRMTELFGVEEILKRPTRVLSLGERMKCEFIMAMLHDPRVVFLDEPTIGLDILAKESIRDFIREMNRQGTTFILTTHDLEDIERLAHRVIVINHGDKVFEDSLSSLKKHLGNKKTIRVAMRGPVPPINWPGVVRMDAENENEAFLLVDNDILPLSDMIAKIGGLGNITDVEIQTLPIEEIIKAIYDK